MKEGCRICCDSLLLAVCSGIKSVPVNEFFSVNGIELFLCNTVGPVAFGNTGLVYTGISSVKEKVLNGKHEKSCVTCEHRSEKIVVAVVKIVAVVSAIIEKTSSRACIKLPNVSEEGIVVVCSRVCYGIVRVVMGEVGVV